jgi:DNA-binding MarR family transcriptional regulator
MTRDLPAGLDVDYELARFVRRVRARSMSRLDELHPQLDYGTFLFFVAIRDAKDGIRGTELAEALGVHKSTASRAISTLDRLGLIIRVPDPEDGRAQLLVGHPDAVAKFDAYRATNHAWLDEIFSTWDADEVAAFARGLVRLNDAAERIP